MSFDVQTLRSASDDDIPSFLRSPENGTTANVNHSTFMEFGRIGKGFRIVNNDSLNDLNVRLHDPNGTILVVPPASELVMSEWFTSIFIQPDGTTGSFQLTLELALLRDAERRR